MKRLALTALFTLLACISASGRTAQDSLKRSGSDSSLTVHSKMLSDNSVMRRYDSAYVWSDPRTLSETAGREAGYWINGFYEWGRNTLAFNGQSQNSAGIFIDGIQVNDIFFGAFDPMSFPVNDVQYAEYLSPLSAFIYGYNSPASGINFISKDVLKSRPFSQLRYSQDRFGSLSADMFFSLPLTRRHGLTIGITKQSFDGRYNNSEFDVWNARSRFNVVLSKSFSARADFCFSTVSRGLNEGLARNPDETALEDDDAVVNNPFAGDESTQFHFGATAAWKAFGKNSLTKFTAYSTNTLRKYDNSISDISLVKKGFGSSFSRHYISNKAGVSQSAGIPLAKDYDLNIFASLSVFDNRFDTAFNSDNSGILLNLKATLLTRYFSLSGFTGNPTAEGSFDDLNKGVEFSIPVKAGSSGSFRFFGGINETTVPSCAYSQSGSASSYAEAGLETQFGTDFRFRQTFYDRRSLRSDSVSPGGGDFSGANSEISFSVYKFFTDASYCYSGSALVPKHILQFDFSYRNMLFRNRLNLRAGFRGSYIHRQDTELISDQRSLQFTASQTGVYVKDQYKLDIYVGARIGRANVNLTLADIFDSFDYGSYLYPYDNRGGFLNSISRFTIVWDFID